MATAAPLWMVTASVNASKEVPSQYSMNPTDKATYVADTHDGKFVFSSPLTTLFPDYTNFYFICTYLDANIGATVSGVPGYWDGFTFGLGEGQIGTNIQKNAPDYWAGNISVSGSKSAIYNRTIVIYIYGYPKETEPTTACTPPTTVTLADPVALSGSTTLSWSGAGNGTGGTAYLINSFEVQSRDVDAGGQADSWTTCATVQVNSGTTYGSCTVYAPASSTGYREFRVRAKCLSDNYHSDYSAAPYPQLRSNPPPTAPTDLTVSTTLFESGNVTLTWSPSVDTTHQVAGYKLQYRTRSSASVSWSEWADVTIETSGDEQISAVVSPVLDRGAQIQYQVCGYDDLGAYGAYAVFPEITRNSAPTTPTGFRSSVSIWESGAIALTWNASTDADNNLDHYVVQYQTSSDGETWSEAVTATTTTTTHSFTPPSSLGRGDYIRFSVKAVDALGAESSEATATVRRNRLPSQPGNRVITPAVFETESLSLSWSASTDPDGSVDHYDLQYQTRTENGSYGTTWTNDGSTAETSITKTPSLARGSFIRYRVRAVDNLGAASAYQQFNQEVQRNKQIGAPTSPAASPAVYETESITFTWAAPAGDHTVDHYEVAYAVSTNGTTWSTETILEDDTDALTYTVASSTFGAARGNYVRLMVRAYDTYNVASAWATATVRRNSAPTAPTYLHFSITTGIFEAMPVTVVYPASTDVDGNLASYQIALMVDETESAVMALTPAAADIVLTRAAAAGDDVITSEITRTVNRGQYIRAAVRAVDAMGAKSAWTYTAGAMKRNVLPSKPVITTPGDEDPPATCLSPNPIFAVAPGRSDADTLTYDAQISTLAGEIVCEWKTVHTEHPNEPAGLPGFRCGINLEPGTYKIKMRVTDGLGSYVESDEVPFTVAAPSWGRVIQSGSIISSNGFYLEDNALSMPDGTTVTNEIMDTTEDVVAENEVLSMTTNISHQEDLRELLNVVNARRAWFSLGPVAYRTEVGYFANWLPQMQQMAFALSECGFIAGEPDLDVYVPGSNYPRASIINAVRGLAENL
jgi:hypothetical protein